LFWDVIANGTGLQSILFTFESNNLIKTLNKTIFVYDIPLDVDPMVSSERPVIGNEINVTFNLTNKGNLTLSDANISLLYNDSIFKILSSNNTYEYLIPGYTVSLQWPLRVIGAGKSDLVLLIDSPDFKTNVSFTLEVYDFISCATDIKQCSDGSFVSRDPENECVFAQCPEVDVQALEYVPQKVSKIPNTKIHAPVTGKVVETFNASLPDILEIQEEIPGVVTESQSDLQDDQEVEPSIKEEYVEHVVKESDTFLKEEIVETQKETNSIETRRVETSPNGSLLVYILPMFMIISLVAFVVSQHSVYLKSKPDDQLLSYVEKSKKLGFSDEVIQETLEKQGWSKEEVSDALQDVHDEEFEAALTEEDSEGDGFQKML
jgi:hypothetical protein